METPGRSARLGRRFVLGAALLWSLSGAVTKGLDLDSGSIAFYRSLFAGLALVAVVPRRRRVFRPALVPLCLVFGAMVGAYIASVKSTTAANAIFLQCTSTFWVVPLGLLVVGDRPDVRSSLGIGLAMLGVVAIVGFGHEGGRDESRGIALGLASGLGYAFVSVGMRSLRHLDPLWLSAVLNLGGALSLGAWQLASGGPIAVPTAAQGLSLLAFGVVQMAIPYALFARGLRDLDAAEAGLIGLVEPVLNPIWVYLAQGERPNGATLIGGGFLLAGVILRYLPSRRTWSSASEEPT